MESSIPFRPVGMVKNGVPLEVIRLSRKLYLNYWLHLSSFKPVKPVSVPKWKRAPEPSFLSGSLNNVGTGCEGECATYLISENFG